MAARHCRVNWGWTLTIVATVNILLPAGAAAQSPRPVAERPVLMDAVDRVARSNAEAGAQAVSRAPDSLLNGALAGLAVGATTGVVLGFTDAGGFLSRHYCENEVVRGNCTQRALGMTAVFAGIGAGVGALIDNARVSPAVYRMADGRRGVRVTVKF
jgi:hypothetical protein